MPGVRGERCLRISGACLVAGVLSGFTSTLNESGVPLLAQFALEWAPGLIFGIAFALAAGASVANVAYFAAVSAIDYYLAVQAYIKISASPGALVAGFGGALVLVLAAQFILHFPIPGMLRVVTIALIGAGAGFFFVMLMASGAGPPASPVLAVSAYSLWQTAVAAAMAWFSAAGPLPADAH